MRPLHRLAVALLGAPVACTPPTTAHKGHAHKAAVAPPAAPDSRPGGDDEPAPSSPGPAPTTTEAPTTTVTILAPRASSSTTTPPAITVATFVVLPETAGAEISDDEWGDRERILACIRSHEGDYGTETGNGYHGAYQFRQGTWDGVVGRAGYPQWVGRRAGDAPAYVQDDAAWLLYSEQAFGPWPPASRYCRGVA